MLVRYHKRRRILRFQRLLLSFASLLSGTVYAQFIKPLATECATQSLSPADQQALEAEAALALHLKRASGPAITAITYVPIRPHIVRRSDGTGGYTLASLNNVLALTNKYYRQNGNGIQFYFAGTTPDYIDNDALYNQYRPYVDDATVAPHDVTNALNQYYVRSFGNSNLGGYAQFPANSVASTRTIILNELDDEDMGNRLVPHELGHTFNLLHTFESTYGYERVTRGNGANCTSAGDLVCDTPADPYGRYAGADYTCIAGCPPNYTCSFTDDQGNAYAPSPTNLMSYYLPCVHDFTAGQYDRIQAGLATRQSHTAYTLDAPETVLTAPSNLVASVTGGSIQISWQDNASTEMGYFIERSTLPTAGFEPIGGVGPDVKLFTDRSFASRTQYYYRVKASNSMTGGTSPLVSVITPDCRPSFTNDGCPYAVTLTGLTLNGTPLSQNSGCSPNGSGSYTSFTAVSGTVTAGQTVPFTVTKGISNTMGVTIGVDMNNNGLFESSERLYQTATADKASMVSGSLVISTSTAVSTVAMRVVGVYSAVPSDPCGTYGYGETEDYQVIIRSACSQPVASLSGSTSLTSGQPTTLTAGLTGTPPFSLTINANPGSPSSFTGITASPFRFTVTPAVSTTYTVGQVANECGVGSPNDAVIVTVNPCTTLYTLKTGDWDDPSVWSCHQLPTQNDLVQIGHPITIPTNFIARALRVVYSPGGQLRVNSTARLAFDLQP